MGTEVSLLAIGKVSDDIREHLNSITTKEGFTIVVNMLSLSTSNQSYELAGLLGFDVYEYEKHVFKGTHEVLTKLGEYYCNEASPMFDYKFLEAFSVLMGKDFTFVFLVK